MKATSVKWENYFPDIYSPRDEQKLAIDFAIKEFKHKKYVLLECPTGVGKSAIAVTLAHYFNNLYPPPDTEKVKSKSKTKAKSKSTGDEHRSKTYIVTTQLILQDQYKNDFPEIANIYSKNNYQCNCDISDFSMTCNEGLKTLSFMKKKDKDKINLYEPCHYMQDYYKFINSPISLTNLSYLLFNRYFSANIPDRKLLIIDECHNVEKTITDFTSIEVSEKILEFFNIPYPQEMYTEEDYFNWISKDYYKKLTEIKTKVESSLFVVIKKEEKNPANLIKLLHRVETEISLVEYFNSARDKIKWVLALDDKSKSFTIKPLATSDFSNYIFDIADNVLLMSGTILDKEVYCQGLGIDVNDCAFISIPSPFPKENRAVYINSCGSMSYNNINSSLPKVVSGINQILQKHFCEKGIIHTHTYKIFDYLEKNVKSDRLIFARQNDRQAAIEKHLASNSPTVLVSPSLTEGLDLKGELSRFQVVCKIPFPYLGDKYIHMKKDNFPGWYEIQTIKTVIQALGRSIRTKEDYAMSYILDSDWNYFYLRNKQFFPEWFKESIIL